MRLAYSDSRSSGQGRLTFGENFINVRKGPSPGWEKKEKHMVPGLPALRTRKGALYYRKKGRPSLAEEEEKGTIALTTERVVHESTQNILGSRSKVRKWRLDRILLLTGRGPGADAKRDLGPVENSKKNGVRIGNRKKLSTEKG